MAEKTYGTPIQEVEIDGTYHKIEGSSSGGITEISSQYIRITDLETGVYKLTYAGTKYIYYSGTAGTSLHTITGGSGAVILTVNRYSTTYRHWYYINGSTGYETIYYGYTSATSGSTGSKAINSLLTSHQTMHYRPIQVNGTQILANTSSTALNLSNDGNVKFAQVSGGQVKASVDIYPVGAIYMSVDSTSPASLFGGTWSQLKDRFLLGAGDTYTNGNTGGEATHTLTIEEIPSHRHQFDKTSSTNFGGGNVGAARDIGANQAFTSYVGGGQAHNNMPPYLVVYMWKRTA